EPPHAHQLDVPYPENGHGDAVVIFEIVVTLDGHVAESRVLAGAEPFLSAAKDAVRAMTFEPATRDGKPITARMRIELPFHENRTPMPVVVEHVEHIEPLVKPKPKLPVIVGVEDVHVRGTRKEIGGSTMSKEDVRDLP